MSMVYKDQERNVVILAPLPYSMDAVLLTILIAYLSRLAKIMAIMASFILMIAILAVRMSVQAHLPSG